MKSATVQYVNRLANNLEGSSLYPQKHGIHKKPSIHPYISIKYDPQANGPQNHQTFQVPEMQVLNPYKAILQVGFPLPLYMSLTFPIGSIIYIHIHLP